MEQHAYYLAAICLTVLVGAFTLLQYWFHILISAKLMATELRIMEKMEDTYVRIDVFNEHKKLIDVKINIVDKRIERHLEETV